MKLGNISIAVSRTKIVVTYKKRNPESASGDYFGSADVTAAALRVLNAETDAVILNTTAMTYSSSIRGYRYVWTFGSALANVDTISIEVVPTRAGGVSATLTPIDVEEFSVENVGKLVWDETLTGATHNVATSAGRRLRNLDSLTLYDGTIVSATANTAILDSGASASDEIYHPSDIFVYEGTGAGQIRSVIKYHGSTREVTIAKPWATNPDATSKFLLLATSFHPHVDSGMCAGATSTTFILDSHTAVATDDTYNGMTIVIHSGTGKDQARVIKDYVGATRTCTLYEAWATTPTTTSSYEVLPTGGKSASLDFLADADTRVSAIKTVVDAIRATDVPAIQTNVNDAEAAILADAATKHTANVAEHDATQASLASAQSAIIAAISAVQSAVDEMNADLGETMDTGGSTTAGTAMGKLNKVLTDLAASAADLKDIRLEP